VVGLNDTAVWPQLRSPRFALLIVTLAFCLVRARDQPGFDVSFGGTTATIVPADLLLVALACTALWTIVQAGVPAGSRVAIAAAAAFSLLLLGSAVSNGSTAFVAGAKVTELVALGLGAAVLVRTREQVEAVVDVLILFTLVADVVGVVRFITNGGRQASFLGEHDFAALATLPLLYGLIRLFTGSGTRRTVVAIVAGAVGCVLGAALASLAGLYLGAAVLLLVVWQRRWWSWAKAAEVVAVVALVTAGTLVIRAGDLGFLQSWFGKPESRPGQYAASWSQRLVYTYIGGRVFLAHPLLGTGWYGELPPKTFVAYLPDARRRFSDQPASYFPPATKPFIPQQTWDQILYELGVIGAAAALTLLAALGRGAVSAARRAAGLLAALPAAWLAASIGALAGEGLFGGTPLAASFWLVAGVVVSFAVQGVERV
jgi:O-antigen ligase/polysaccharide polymerase Wzy-like membrane protein